MRTVSRALAVRLLGRPVLAAAAALAALCGPTLAQAQTGTVTVASASADWTRVTLGFGQALDGGSVPPASAFSVLVGGTPRALAGVSVSGDSVVLALTLPISRTDVITVSYDAPADGGLEDEAGNAVTSFTRVTATNDTPARLATQGPGLGNLIYSESESFEAVSWIQNLGPRRDNPNRQLGVNLGLLLNGYFVTVFSADGGRGPGGLLFYDISDPRNIRQVRRIYDPDGETKEIREAHSLPLARIGSSVYLAVQSTKGIEIWDLTDVDDIHRESRLRLPGVDRGDYQNVAWQTSWQAPYLYVASSSQGIYIVDVSDPAAPFIANRGHRRPNPVPPAEYGGFRAGPIFAMGNHLVVTGMKWDGWSSLDIGNPLNPVLLDTVGISPNERYYASCFDGQRVYSSPDGRTADVVAYDLADPTSFVRVDTGLRLGNRKYCGTQDHFLFEGGQANFKKIDTGTNGSWVEAGTGTLGVGDPDAGQVSPMGNLVFVGNDHGTGSAFFVHNTNPDLTPPHVIQVSPRNRSINQPVATRVGIAFSDSVLFESVGADSVRLLDGEGSTVSGTYSAALGIVNFAPAEPLQANTTYTVQILADGVSDYAGNRVETEFRTTFTTSPDLPVDPIHRWELADHAEDWFDRNDGTVVGAAFETGGGVRLSGQGAWIKLDRSLSRVLSGHASMAFFLSTTQTGNAAAGEAPGVTGGEDSNGTGDAYWGWLDDTGRLRLSVGNGDGIRSKQPVNDGNMHHYVLTRDGTTGRLAMYRDGVKVGEGTGDSGTKDGGGSYDRLGAIEGSTASLRGMLKDIQVFDRVLTDYQVSLLFGGAATGFTQATLDAFAFVGVATNFEAEAHGDETTTYQWDFGDGSSSAASSSRTATHTYTQPGHYTVVLTVRIGSRVLRYSHVYSVAYPRTRAPPAVSSSIIGAGNLVYKSNPDNFSVTAIDRRALSRVWEIHVGKNPRTVGTDALGRVWVAVQGDDRLACLDTSGVACGSIETGHGSAPFGIAFLPGTDIGLVTLQGSGEVLRFDASTATVLTRRKVNAEPRGIAISHDGAHAYVTRMRSTGAGLVTKIDALTLTNLSSISLQVDRTTVDAENRARGKPNYLTQFAISPDGRTAWVPSKQDNVLRGKLRDGLALTHDSTVRAIASVIDLSSSQELSSRRIDFDDRSGSVAVAFSPLGDYAFVALQGSNSVAIVDAYTGSVRGALAGGAGLAPDGIWIDELARRAFVSNFTTRSVSVYDIAPVLASVSFEPALEQEIGTVGFERLGSEELRGLQIFYNARDPRMSREGYISCASCHLGGDEDGTVWDFTARGEGLRNTIALNGREGTAFGNLHWTANFDEVQDFEHDIRDAFGGSGFLTQADFGATSEPLGVRKAGRNSDLDALAAYVSALDDFGRSPYRTSSGGITEAATEGRRLFGELGCQNCHSGTGFTDGERHDVGTIVADSGTGSGQALGGVGFKTPTLLGVWRTAPYFHNGSKSTLAGVIDSRHGGERALTAAERDKLVAFLRSLERPTAGDALLAKISNLPRVHDGSTEFSFTLEFSLEVQLSFRDFRDGLFELTGAAVTGVRRLEQGSNKRWEVTLRPTSSGFATIVVPANRDCSQTGAVCSNGLPLSERLAVSVPGPAVRTLPVAAVSAVTSPITEGGAASFIVSLDSETAEALSVAFSVSETGGMLSGTALTEVAFALGESSKTVSLATTNDDIVEPDSTVTVALAEGNGYTLGEANVAALTIQDDDAATFTVSAEPQTIAEGESATLTVAISNEVTFAQDQTISLATSGTASVSDYTGLPATLTLGAGVSSATALLTAAADEEEESAETVTVTASHGGSAVGSATVTIESVSRDATLAGLSLSGVDIKTFSGGVTSYQASVAHSVTATTVTATASHSGATVLIEPGSQVSLAEGANEIAVTVTAEDGTTRTYRVTVTRAALPVATIVAGTTPVTEGTAVLFTVTLDRAAPEALTVGVSVTESGAALAGAPPESVSFAQGATSAPLSVPTTGDSVVEGDSTVTATVTSGAGYAVGTAASASMVVQDDDIATFSVSADAEAIREGGSATLTVAITNGVTFEKDQSISLAVSGTASASDFTVVPTELTLAAGASSATAELTASEDREEEEPETVTLTASRGGSAIGSATLTITNVSQDATLGGLSLSGIDIGTFAAGTTAYSAEVAHAVASTTVTATAAHPAATVGIEPAPEVTLAEGANEIAITVTAEDGLTTETYTVTVTRAGLPVASIAAGATPVTEGTPAEFTLSLDAAAPAALTVAVNVAESGSVLSGTPPSSVAFAKGATSATLSVPTAGDSVVEADGTVTATLIAGSGYSLGTDVLATVAVEDDDAATFTVTAEPQTIAEGESATLTVTISNEVTFAQDQTISLATSGTASASDYTGLPATLTLGAGVSSATALLTAAADEEEESAETVTVTASHGGSAVGSATVTIESVSQDATLAGLSLSGIDIGVFSSTVTAYQASVAHSVTATTVTATATHSGATVSIAPGPEVPLAEGANEITVTVTAENGTTTQTYTATVTRSSLPVVSIVAVEERVSEAEMGRFRISRTGPILEPLEVPVLFASSTSRRARTLTVRFVPGQRSVTRRVQNVDDTIVEDDVTVTWTLQEGEGYTVSGESASASVVFEENDVPEFAVTLEPGEIAEGETATLTVAITNGVRFRAAQTITLAASGTASASDYRGLPETLRLSAYGTSPTFSATARLTAVADREAEAAETLTVTASHGGSAVGSATVTIESVSQDATLSALSLSGIDIGRFAAATTAYRTSVAHAVTATTVTATATHPGATVSIAPGPEVALAEGANEIAVTVTAEDGTTTRTYTVTVTRRSLPVVSIAAVEDRVSEADQARFRVSRTGTASEPLEVPVRLTSTRSSKVQNLTVRFLPRQRSVTSRVEVGDDTIAEDDLTVTYTLQAGAGYAVSEESASASVVFEENDVPEFAVTLEPGEIAEGGTATLTVAITNGVTFREPQTITLAASGTASASDYRGLPETLRLSAYGTSATFSATARLTAVADGEEEAEETVTVTASHGGAEIGSATLAIAAGAAPPLTAEFLQVPATHDGQAAFTFELRFGREPALSYTTLRDAALQVTGGTVRRAKRLVSGSNLRWEITVEPSAEADVALTLPATADCAAVGAICTAGGSKLAQAVSATVSGPRAEAAGFPLARANSRPSGIWSDGETAWVADLDDAKLYAYRRTDGARQPGRDIVTEPGPMGLWSDGETLWVAGLEGGLRAHRLADGARLAARDLALEGEQAPAGVWSDGETVWAAGWLGDRVRAYRLADGERLASRDIALGGENLMPVGLWSDGQTLWVADWRERLYAYRLADGQRVPQHDVEVSGTDTDPTGLWSGGGTLLATGWEGREVRAYRLPAVAGDPDPGGHGGWTDSVPMIADPGLRAAIRAALGKAPGETVSAGELGGLESLSARNGGVRDLAGLEAATGLKDLDLGFNPLADLRQLTLLPALESLNLDGAALDLRPLAALAGLRRLSVRHNLLDELQPLAALAELIELDIGDNRIEDLRPLAGLARLAVLRADRNGIADLWPLASLTDLEVLDLATNDVRELQPLAGLERLRTLRLDGNRLSELHPLSGLRGLEDLGLASTAVRNLAPIAGLHGLRRLDLRGSAARDLRPLRRLASLASVHVGGSRIEDLGPLDGLDGLSVDGRDDLEPPGAGDARLR